jgi:hypothetical protein
MFGLWGDEGKKRGREEKCILTSDTKETTGTCRLENNIKMDLKGRGWADVDWILMWQNSDQ